MPIPAHRKRRKTAFLGGFSKKGGPSDRIRTCGILLPKQARYQLRYTRICTFRCGSMRLHTFCTHANLKEQRRFPPRPHSAIPLSGGARFLTAQAANLNILQFA